MSPKLNPPLVSDRKSSCDKHRRTEWPQFLLLLWQPFLRQAGSSSLPDRRKCASWVGEIRERRNSARRCSGQRESCWEYKVTRFQRIPDLVRVTARGQSRPSTYRPAINLYVQQGRSCPLTLASTWALKCSLEGSYRPMGECDGSEAERPQHVGGDNSRGPTAVASPARGRFSWP